MAGNLSGAVLLLRSLNLLYHRINQLHPDPWTLCVSPAHLAEHLQVIKRYTPRSCVTFDDGYEDNLSNALPLLEKYDVPARFFVTSGALGRRTEMWWDALDLLFLDSGSYTREFSRLRLLSFEHQENELDKMFAARGLSREHRPERRMLTENELTRLAASSLARIGAHTVTHPVLSQLPFDEQEKEIGRSKQRLQELIGSEVSAFSYPNGTDADYTHETVAAVRRAGFTMAYSAFNHARPDRFQLPRVMIRDWDGDEFERNLRASGI